MNRIVESFSKLQKYCEAEDYKGWDPYDGLNSRIFNAVPLLNKSALCRLIMIQLFKRNPINLRRIAMVPKQHNPKAIALFLSGYCNLYQAIEADPKLQESFGKKQTLKSTIDRLAKLLLLLRSKGDFHGACWGYNFDWQARRLFLFPRYTPTVVVTSFCATALFDAYEITGEKEYLKGALSTAGFVINDLHRTPYGSGFLFSYSHLSGNDTVFNASLLGVKILSLCYKYTHISAYRELASQAVKAVCDAQRPDGGWVYGLLPLQSWIDSFHTGYNLEALDTYRKLTGDRTFDENIERGFDFYINNFFEEDGTPKYYHDKIYPIDIHCPGQFLVTLSALNKLSRYHKLAERVVEWTIKTMQDRKGYFYYQIRPFISSKISYMRWSNAFMFNALSHYLKSYYCPDE
ncbi:MAG: delta-aminolevulinic acid dehydratase [Muribaculaceae bacterium]|nr:delta-aminolevulinic acid dehydratase [Muribaculaceae bacterium]